MTTTRQQIKRPQETIIFFRTAGYEAMDPSRVRELIEDLRGISKASHDGLAVVIPNGRLGEIIRVYDKAGYTPLYPATNRVYVRTPRYDAHPDILTLVTQQTGVVFASAPRDDALRWLVAAQTTDPAILSTLDSAMRDHGYETEISWEVHALPEEHKEEQRQ